VVTGANRGVGREIARGLAEAGSRVVLVCRDLDKAIALREELHSDTGNDTLEAVGLDLADTAAIYQFVERFRKGHNQLHVLVNNAATYSGTRKVAPNGFELTWATNVLGPYLLTELLLDLMEQTGNHKWHARVVNVCSKFDGGLESKDTQFESRRYDGVKAYKASKQALRMLTWDLDDRLPGTGIVANACFPGRVDTPLGRLKNGGLGGLFSRKGAMRPVAVGADTPIWLASSPEVEGISGALFFERNEIECTYQNAGACVALGAFCAQQLDLE
jgi:NAD(P)-dependent dehydrogenase (short-subunit alcohol dehydrogenase family)